jgi:putative ABC transport system substrate-binding protein
MATSSPSDVPARGAIAATSKHFAAAFDQGLREHGYRQGQNIVVERRFAEAKAERMSDIAAELVRLKVDVIVTSTDPGIAAVRAPWRS